MKLVFFVGTGGTGKSFIADKLSEHFSWAYLDMDTVGTPFVNKMLEMSGQDPNDRDSKFYKEHLRDLPYIATMDVALDNLKVGLNAALIGPFTREIANPDWITTELKKKDLDLSSVDVKVLIVEVENPEVEKERIEERGFERDQWKLEHWQDYKKEKKVYQITWPIPEENVLRFDNSGEFTDGKLQKLIAFIKN